MEFLIVRGLSSILEAILWTYFIVSFAKILSKKELHFSKKQITIFLALLIILFEIRMYYKKYLSFI